MGHKRSKEFRGNIHVAKGILEEFTPQASSVSAVMNCETTFPWLQEQKFQSENSKPYYLNGFPVVISRIEGRGRGLVTERKLLAGDLVLSAARMGSAIRLKQDKYWCHECLQHRLEEWSPPLPVACSQCEAVWCCSG